MDDGGTFPDPNGESMEYAKDPGLDNNTGSSWCEGYLLFGDGDRGTPGEANTCCFSESCMYLEVDISTQATMRATLHRSIDDHIRLPYTSTSVDTWDILEIAEEDPDTSSNVIDVYRNATFPKAGGGNDNYDREHTWPRSYGFPRRRGLGRLPLYRLPPSLLGRQDLQQPRPLEPPLPQLHRPRLRRMDDRYQQRQGRPRPVQLETRNWLDRHLGDLARPPRRRRPRDPLPGRALRRRHPRRTAEEEPDLIATDDPTQIVVTGGNAPIAYMGVLSDLIAWHEEDPSDAQEQWRNQVVFTFQRNRNPFIDHPEWVRCVYLEDCGEVFLDGFESGDSTAWSQTVP